MTTAEIEKTDQEILLGTKQWYLNENCNYF